MNYYNEFEPYAAQWLRNLISKGLIPAGDVDERDIRNVEAKELKKYTQCHFFAGIGGWAHALKLGAWPDDRPVWTGSCPCQPFSQAGKRTRQQDERHLWPHWARLIRECRPSVVFGEQVASAVAAGWFDDVAHDLEAASYSVAASILPACAAGGFHRRDRLWFVGDAEHNGRYRRSIEGSNRPPIQNHAERAHSPSKSSRTSQSCNVADSDDERRQHGEAITGGNEAGMGAGKSRGKFSPNRCDVYMADGTNGMYEREFAWGDVGGHEATFQRNPDPEVEWVECPDGKRRPIKPGLRLLANGVSARVGRLRAYGNAIDSRIAAEFIKAYLQTL